MFYCQCHLEKGNIEQVASLPEKFAKRGKYVKLRGDDGWRVMSVGKRISDKEVVIYINHKNI